MNRKKVVSGEVEQSRDQTRNVLMEAASMDRILNELFTSVFIKEYEVPPQHGKS